MKGPAIIGCTGGIGSGKTNVVLTFAALGIPGYDCDSRAKQLYDEDPELLAEVAAIAGEDVVIEGRLDRSRLAAKIFNDRDMLERLERVVHPAVIRDFSSWLQKQNSKLVIFESAILLDKPYLREMADCVLLVTAPEEVRIDRVVARDGLPREAVARRIANQMSDDERRKMADYIIETNDREAMLPTLLSIIQKWQQI